jgi:hypothetical protein
MPEDTDRSLFVTYARTPPEKEGARLLIESLRAFGGELRFCPVWLFEMRPRQAPCRELEDAGVRVLSLHTPEALPDYYFAGKVAACAQAEELAPSSVRSLVWVDPTCLIVQPPLLFDLHPSHEAAVRPVHIKNVGLLAAEPLNDFWMGVYEEVGVPDVETTVETFVGGRHIRSYFNSHAFAVDPSRGLMREWRARFEALVDDEAYQDAACRDTLHQVFLHQAVLSALLATDLDSDRLRILPPEYNYPYNLQASVPAERRARTLNEPVCLTYEGRTLEPDLVEDVVIHDPLRSWLADRVTSG